MRVCSEVRLACGELQIVGINRREASRAELTCKSGYGIRGLGPKKLRLDICKLSFSLTWLAHSKLTGFEHGPGSASEDIAYSLLLR